MHVRKLISSFHKRACFLCLTWAFFQVGIMPFFFESAASSWAKVVVSTVVTAVLWIVFPRYVMRRRMHTVSTKFYRALQLSLAVFFLIFLTSSFVVHERNLWGSPAKAAFIYLSISSFLIVLIAYRAYGSCMYRFMAGHQGHSKAESQ
jgi:hypothetical protein